MALAFRFPEQVKMIELLDPATDAAGRTGLVVTLKHAHKAWIVFHVQQGNAATILVSLLQGTGGAGTSTLTGSKAAPASPLWWNLDTSLTDTLVKQADAATFTTDAPTKNKMLVWEVDPNALDVANGFKDITISTGASNALNVTQAIAYIYSDRYGQSTPPTAFID